MASALYAKSSRLKRYLVYTTATLKLSPLEMTKLFHTQTRKKILFRSELRKLG